MDAPDKIDVNDLFGKRASISIDRAETPQEHDARILKEKREAVFDLVRNYVLFFVVLFVIMALGSLLIYLAMFDATASADTKKLAFGAVITLFTNCLAFLLGRGMQKK